MATTRKSVQALRDSIAYDELDGYEIRWRDRQLFLQSKGYMLRPRLRPGWIPSWHTTGQKPWLSEDSIPLPMRPHLVDATRVSDGRLVYIKRVKTGDLESSLAIMLSSPSMRNDSRNHSVPILDHFIDNEDPAISYIVMPFLFWPDAADFENTAQIIDFVDQILEGLAFMHEKGIAHRDCNYENIMMDSLAMYPRGIHPAHPAALPDGITPADTLPRSMVNITYYFIDYGISSYFPPGQPRGLVVGRDGRDRDVPELSDTIPYDPFAVDVFIIGNIFRLKFYEIYSNVDFLRPLIARATGRDPASRPNAQELLNMWTAQKRRISLLSKKWRLKKRDEYLVVSVLRDCYTMLREILRVISSHWRLR